jgi:hypothetical protein
MSRRWLAPTLLLLVFALAMIGGVLVLKASRDFGPTVPAPRIGSFTVREEDYFPANGGGSYTLAVVRHYSGRCYLVVNRSYALSIIEVDREVCQ